MGIAEYLRLNASKYPDKESLVLACIKELDVPRRNVVQRLIDIRNSKNPIAFGAGTTPVETSRPKPFRGLSEGEIRAKHDTKFIFSKAVKALERGLFIADADFIKQCDIKSHVGYRQVLDDPDFKQYRGRAGGITYWSHPDSIEKMKNEGILT